MSIKFEWDNNKENSNLIKHKIDFEEAKSVFYDFLSQTINDPDHSKNEFRYITIGYSNKNRLLIVSHTDRDNNIRIISARFANKNERNKYEER
jgi:uncharacterized protein